MKKKPEIDFETYCNVKHDGDEYRALRALAKVTIEDSTAVAGLSDEGYRAVCDSLTQGQLSTLWDIIKIALQEDPERLAEFIAFHEQREKEKQKEAEAFGGENNASGYAAAFIFGIIIFIVLVVGIIRGWFSPGYIVYVIIDAVATVKMSGKASEYFRNRRG